MECVAKPTEGRNEYCEIDEALAAQLAPVRSYLKDEEVLVRALPDVAAAFGERTDAGDLYFVLSEGEANLDETGRFLSETWQLALVVMLPNRYSKGGVYDVFKRARNCLIGFKPPYCTKPIGAPSWRFIRDEAYWVIEAQFPFDVYILDLPINEPEEIPLVKRLVIEGYRYSEVIE